MWCRWGAGIAARAGERTPGRSGESGKGCCAAIRLAGSSSSHDSVSGHAGWRPWPGLCLQSCGPWVSGPRNRRARSWSAGGMRREERPCPSPGGAFSMARFDGPTGMDHRAMRIGRAHRHGDAEARFTPAPASAAIRAAKHQRTAPGVARIPPRGSCAGLPPGKGRKRHRSAIFVMLKPATAQNVTAPA